MGTLAGVVSNIIRTGELGMIEIGVIQEVPLIQFIPMTRINLGVAGLKDEMVGHRMFTILTQGIRIELLNRCKTFSEPSLEN